MRRQADEGRSLSTLAHAHESLPEFPTLCPDAVPLALTSMASKALDDAARVLALCPSVLPMAFSQVLEPDRSIPSSLIDALLMAISNNLSLVDAMAFALLPAPSRYISR
ncbi:MAG: hypothetical protein MH252_07175 [Thermosynechococcaceae cyanobacterium MS004]|nr:hypothetical protein [Thermosynechococcaceae cyanobacterium MS004]